MSASAALAQELRQFPPDAPLPTVIEASLIAQLDENDFLQGASRWEGNLAGDTTPDQLVQAAYSPKGGNGVYLMTWVFVGAADGFSSMVPLEINGGITSARIEGKALVLTTNTYLPTDARCCPSGTEVTRVPLN
jgi:hypothetical protein